MKNYFSETIQKFQIPKVKLWQKWSLTLKVIPVVIAVVLIKLLVHHYGWEVITLNALFTSILAATIFLIGFLISGVLSDYKESEKIPSELASSLEVLYDETSIIYKNKKSKEAKEFLRYQFAFVEDLKKWFYKQERTKNILEKVSGMNNFFLELESQTQANFLSRMKQEQNNIRKYILRIHTIKETNFVASAYAILEAISFLMILGMVIIKIEPFYESLFFVIIVTFLLRYMVSLIKDLDNPFEYKEHGETGSEISLKPIHNYSERLHENLEKMKLEKKEEQ